MASADIDRLQASQFDFSPWCEVVLRSRIPLVVTSVVPQQLRLWRDRLPADVIELDDVPLQKLYPTLGVDRALAALGAGTQYGFPVLAIDGGTALTLTGVDGTRSFVGGAILPGLRSQLTTLGQKTAALPTIDLSIDLSGQTALPPRWASDTPTAIRSGIVYTVLAGLRDFIETWWQQYPRSAVVLTGGDGEILRRGLSELSPEIGAKVRCDANVLFWGMNASISFKTQPPLADDW